MSVDCLHAEYSPARPAMVHCDLGRYGGRPSAGTCGICPERKPGARVFKPEPVIVESEPIQVTFTPRLRSQSQTRRVKVLRPVCESCDKYRGPHGAFKIKCEVAECVPCGISLAVGPCPKGKWLEPLVNAKLLDHGEITASTPSHLIEKLIDSPLPEYDYKRWPADFFRWPNVIAAHRSAFHGEIERARIAEAPNFDGRGTVIVGGGKYFASAYVTIRILRHVGCSLPIELWYFGRKNEMTARDIALIEPFDVACVDADLMAEDVGGIRMLNGWELKPFAVMQSRFREVLYLDADSYPVVNPEFIFSEPDYEQHGAIFWPDKPSFDLRQGVWDTVDIPYRDEPDFESGQFIIDKSRCWTLLHLAHWMNQHSDFYYRLFWGDKSTYHLCARALGIGYGMPAQRWRNSRGTMVQHDMHGRVLFNHRTRDKFTLANKKEGFAEFWTTEQSEQQVFNPELKLEEEAHGFLKDLADAMGLKVPVFEPAKAEVVPSAPIDPAAFETLRKRNRWPEERPKHHIGDVNDMVTDMIILRQTLGTESIARQAILVFSTVAGISLHFAHRGALVIMICPQCDFGALAGQCWDQRGRIIPVRLEDKLALREIAHQRIVPSKIFIDCHDRQPQSIVELARLSAAEFREAEIFGNHPEATGTAMALQKLDRLGVAVSVSESIWRLA